MYSPPRPSFTRRLSEPMCSRRVSIQPNDPIAIDDNDSEEEKKKWYSNVTTKSERILKRILDPKYKERLMKRKSFEIIPSFGIGGGSKDVTDGDRPLKLGRRIKMKISLVLNDIQKQLNENFLPLRDSTLNPNFSVHPSCVLRHYFNKNGKLNISVKNRALGLFAERDFEVGEVKILYYGKARCQSISSHDSKGYKMCCYDSELYFNSNENKIIVIDGYIKNISPSSPSPPSSPSSPISALPSQNSSKIPIHTNAIGIYVNHAPDNVANCQIVVEDYNLMFITNKKKIRKNEELFYSYSEQKHNRAFFPKEGDMERYCELLALHQYCNHGKCCEPVEETSADLKRGRDEETETETETETERERDNKKTRLPKRTRSVSKRVLKKRNMKKK